MDAKLFLILVYTYICGTYNNRLDLLPTFKGNVADAIDMHKIPKKPVLPHNLKDYGIIGENVQPNTESKDKGIQSFLLYNGYTFICRYILH